MSDVVVAVNALAQLPEVPEAIDAAREACTALRWHPALRRRIPEASAESRVRGATASAALDGAQMSVTIVRDVFRGARSWPAASSPPAMTTELPVPPPVAAASLPSAVPSMAARS